MKSRINIVFWFSEKICRVGASAEALFSQLSEKTLSTLTYVTNRFGKCLSRQLPQSSTKPPQQKLEQIKPTDCSNQLWSVDLFLTERTFCRAIIRSHLKIDQPEVLPGQTKAAQTPSPLNNSRIHRWVDGRTDRQERCNMLATYYKD